VSSILGVSAGFHDAALSVVSSNGDILFAGHSERYSKNKHDSDLCAGIVQEVMQYNIDTIAYYERPWNKQLRQFYSGQGVEWNKFTTRQILNQQLFTHADINAFRVQTHNHHLSHAAAGFQTSPFDRATVVVIDAIGEWDTISIWGAEYNARGVAQYKCLWRQRYPHSIGMFYSAMTNRVGLRPMDEEYILMGMAAYGQTGIGDLLGRKVVKDFYDIKFTENLHLGVGIDYLSNLGDMDIAAAAQEVAETLIYNVMDRARQFAWSNNLVYMGGVALNCLANRRLGEYFDRIWIMPNPGDAGSSLGAAALSYGMHLNWNNPYLGHLISGDYPVNDALDTLLSDRIVGVASGRAEFGPRALGNRSLLADPRGPDIKGKVNEIKRRQQFRPFAPVILEELVDQYFDMPAGWSNSPYMQSVGVCRRPDLYPAIIHHDGTSRVQTVSKNAGSGIRELLEKWYVMTDCPMLLNTSLNIRGEPMVNDRLDADRFEKMYGIRVVS
jgi:carbamoyltransferase